MLIMPSFKKSLIVEQYQGNYLKLYAMLFWSFYSGDELYFVYFCWKQKEKSAWKHRKFRTNRPYS